MHQEKSPCEAGAVHALRDDIPCGLDNTMMPCKGHTCPAAHLHLGRPVLQHGREEHEVVVLDPHDISGRVVAQHDIRKALVG